jgi:hypothetical protein
MLGFCLAALEGRRHVPPGRALHALHDWWVGCTLSCDWLWLLQDVVGWCWLWLLQDVVGWCWLWLLQHVKVHQQPQWLPHTVGMCARTCVDVGMYISVAVMISQA